jgi:micrococcal nuclease
MGANMYTYRVKSVNRIVDGDTLEGSMGKYGRVLGWLFVGDEDVSLNEQMINEGFAWKYDGGTKEKDLQQLINIRKSQGTY